VIRNVVVVVRVMTRTRREREEKSELVQGFDDSATSSRSAT
jgi:hypothetical protein